jgi:parallel beta-helix repeat protein
VEKERKHMPNRASRCFLLLIMFMFLLALVTNMTSVADLEGKAAQSTTAFLEPEKSGRLVAGTPHGSIAIDGDDDFSATALQEGWPGEGSPEHPHIIDGLDILGGYYLYCISISNTTVSFTICNCILTGALGAGIRLENVTNGELANNTCNNNLNGIQLYESSYNTVVNNTCTGNDEIGISLIYSHWNTVTNNTCSNNGLRHLGDGSGIYLGESDFNTVANNTCSDNRTGICLYESDFNIVVNNTCTSNEEANVIDGSGNISDLTLASNRVILLLIELVAITLVGAGLWKVSTRGGQDDIIVPIWYRLVSWFYRRRSVKHVDADETPEPDSSDQ